MKLAKKNMQRDIQMLILSVEQNILARIFICTRKVDVTSTFLHRVKKKLEIRHENKTISLRRWCPFFISNMANDWASRHFVSTHVERQRAIVACLLARALPSNEERVTVLLGSGFVFRSVFSVGIFPHFSSRSQGRRHSWMPENSASVLPLR